MSDSDATGARTVALEEEVVGLNGEHGNDGSDPDANAGAGTNADADRGTTNGVACTVDDGGPDPGTNHGTAPGTIVESKAAP